MTGARGYRGRWSSDEGQRRVHKILALLREGRTSEIEGIVGRFSGRCDLRGFPFPEPVPRRESVQISGLAFELIEGREEFKRNALARFDFSHASLARTSWRNCVFEECLFEGTDLRLTRFWACDILKSRFIGSDLRDCLLAGRIGRNGGRILGTVIEDGHFSDVHFSFPNIAGCSFDCDMTNVDFDGSQLKDCKFSGRLDRVIFRRKSSANVKFIPENRMEHVDFSEADLHDIDFWNGVDLTKCIFPAGKRSMFLVLDGPQVFAEVRRQIESSWNGEDRRIGLGYTANYFMDRIKDGQRHFLIDEDSIIEDWGESLGRRYVAMMRTVAQRLGALGELGHAPHDSSSNRG